MKKLLVLIMFLMLSYSVFAFTATGGTITYSGGYTIHNFTSDGDFNVTEGGAAHALLIGGGGGGGYLGGGGAGGYLYNDTLTLGVANFPVVIGIGGVASTFASRNASREGSNTTFNGLIATGGGGGGDQASDGKDGASGGGAGAIGIASGGTSTSQGNDGGAVDNSGVPYPSGGGGGAGGVGGLGTGSTSGDGGTGITNNITGGNTCFAGGGSGSATTLGGSRGAVSCGGGLGRSGAGTGDAGTDGLGGGGGGGWNAAGSAGGVGGNGTVIIRYLTSTIDITANTPLNNSHLNDDPINFTFNTTSDINNSNVTLYLNGVANRTITNYSDGANWLNASLADGNYSWYLLIESGNNSASTAAGNMTLIVDTVNPDWTVNANNFFTINATTNYNPLLEGETLQWNLTLDDLYIFGYEILLYNSTNGLKWNYTRTGLTSTQENITNTTNITAWPSGTYNITNLTASDDHTINFIPDYAYTTTSNAITYTTPTNTISIEAEVGNLKGLTTEKLTDRYTFSFERNSAATEHGFVLTCDETLYYRGDLYEYPTFVCGSNWVDFALSNGYGIDEIRVTQLSDNRYNVNFKFLEPHERLDFDSIGGLNIYNACVTEGVCLLEIDRTPRQSENLTAAERAPLWINLSWNDTAEATGATLYFGNGTLITNYTNGTNWFNVSGLADSTSYTFWILAFYNESGNSRYNTSSTGENNLTVSTTGNGTININVYDEDTNALITESLTVTVSGNASEQSFITTNGQVAVGSLTNGSYTISAYGVNYTQRTTNLTITGVAVTANIYLVRDASLVTFTFVDADTTSFTIEGAVMSMYRYINATRILVELRTSDISGKSRFSYSDGAAYEFEVDATGYNHKNFSLNPILFSEYNVIMTKNFTSGDADYNAVLIAFAPSTFHGGGDSNSFNISIYSPEGFLLTYGYTISTPDGTYTDSGTTSGGEAFTESFLINSSNIYDYVNLTYFYSTTLSARRNFSQSFLIANPRNSTTILGNRGETYGLGALERALLGTVIIIMIGGIASLLAGSVAGGAVVLLLLGSFALIGFWSWWAVLPSLLVGVIMIGGSKQ